ncbi:HAD-IA family hydrolase [Nesterenkonia sp. F]|uniref:HAD-IA family hydrolase n=1 Tax=Nesterenkonia sp. F TaxID=795955 RepID=UPI000255CB15|nr:HAD-IA family hydrolase [Nesterenkonia sp. F]
MTAAETAPQGSSASSRSFTVAAALLDMDGTLVDSSAAVERVWLRWAEPFGLDPERVLQVAHGRQGHETMAILLPDRPMEQNIEDNRRLLASEEVETDGIVEIPGAAELLTALQRLPHALVTSASLGLARARMGAARLAVPEQRVTAEDVSASKPDPEGFVRAARRLGVDPADTVVFEDSPVGVQAGLAAGATVIGVGAGAAAHGPTHAVEDLTGVSVAADAAGRLSIRLG